MDYAEAVRAARSPTPPKVGKAAAGWQSGECSDLSDGDDSADEGAPAPTTGPDLDAYDSADEEAAELAANDEQPKKKRKSEKDANPDQRAERAAEMALYDQKQRVQIEQLPVTTNPDEPHELTLDGYWVNQTPWPARAVCPGLFVVQQCGMTKDGQPIYDIIDGVSCTGSAKQNPSTMFVSEKRMHVLGTTVDMDEGEDLAKCAMQRIDHDFGELYFPKGCPMTRSGGGALWKETPKNAFTVNKINSGTLIGHRAYIDDMDPKARVYVSSGSKPNKGSIEGAGTIVEQFAKDAYNKYGVGTQFVFLGGGSNGGQVRGVFDKALRFTDSVLACTTAMGELNQVKQTEQTMPTAAQAMSEMSVAFPFIWQIAAVLTPDGCPVNPQAQKILALIEGVPGLAKTDSLVALVEYADTNTDQFAADVRGTFNAVCEKIDLPLWRKDKFYNEVKKKCTALIEGTTMTLLPIVEALLDKMFNIVNSLGVYVRLTRAEQEVKMLRDKEHLRLEQNLADRAQLSLMQNTVIPAVEINVDTQETDEIVQTWLEGKAPVDTDTVEAIIGAVRAASDGTAKGLADVARVFGDGPEEDDNEDAFDFFVNMLSKRIAADNGFSEGQERYTSAILRQTHEEAFGARRSNLVATLLAPIIDAQNATEKHEAEEKLLEAARKVDTAKKAYGRRRTSRKTAGKPAEMYGFAPETNDSGARPAKRPRVDSA